MGAAPGPWSPCGREDSAKRRTKSKGRSPTGRRTIVPATESGTGLARSGDAAGARAVLEQLRKIAARSYVPPTSFVWVHAGLGEFADALAWIERAIDDRDSFIIPIKTYAFFDPLRADPRFQALLRKMNLEP